LKVFNEEELILLRINAFASIWPRLWCWINNNAFILEEFGKVDMSEIDWYCLGRRKYEERRESV
jgi:hypothetical protein